MLQNLCDYEQEFGNQGITQSLITGAGFSAGLLAELPSPPEGKIGWPWTEETVPLPPTMPDGRQWPKISIVTPNYNYDRFLEEAIRSVLLQGYPNLEYIIIDGNSTDNSVEIIKKYEKWLTYWVSEPDRGPGHSVNKGLDIATGEWVNWINSDDLLMPNALETLTKIIGKVKDVQWISGGRLEMDESGSFVDICVPWRTDPAVIGLGLISLPQNATFIRLDFLKQHQLRLLEDYNNVVDTIFHYQLVQYTKPLLTSAIFAVMRWHGIQKTSDLNRIAQENISGVLPYVKQLPLLNRLFIRLLRTRLAQSLRAILLLAIFYGLTPYICDWKAVVFDRRKYDFQLTPARLAMLCM